MVAREGFVINADTYAHYAPQRILDALVTGRASFRNNELMHEDDTFTLGFVVGALARPVNSKLRYPEPR